MISLWIAAILVLFVFGLAQRAWLNLKIVRNQKNRLRAYNLAKAGINKAIMLAEEDAGDSQTKDYDTILECGVSLKERDPKEIFREGSTDNGEGFEIGLYNNNEFIYGLTDEDSKINLDSDFLATLLQKRQVEGGIELAQTIRGWMNPESSLANLGSSRIPKKEALNTPEELILILEYFFSSKNILDTKEKARQEYEKFKDFVTIFGDGKININTASRETLEILTGVFAQQNSLNIDTDALASRIIELRDAPQRKYYKNIGELEEDIQQDQNLNLDDMVKGSLISFLAPLLKYNSDYLKINAKGFVGNTIKQVNMVYDRTAKKVVYWHEN